MALPSNELLTFAQVGRREDLVDMIYNVSPYDTPFLTRSAKASTRTTQHDWLTDVLETANLSNAQLEGDDFAADVAAEPTRLKNFTQICRRTVQISESTNQALAAGRKQEYQYQLLVKKTKAMKIDMESIALSNQAGVIGASGVARTLIPVTAWYKTNVQAAGDGANPTLSNSVPTTGRTDGTARALTETLLKSLLQSIYNNSTGEVDVISVGTTNRTVISGFAGPSGTQRVNEAAGKVLYATIDFYDSDFGRHEIVVDRFQRARDLHAHQSDKWKTVYFRPFAVKDMPPTGDSVRGMVIAEWTVESSNEAASGIIADLTT